MSNQVKFKSSAPYRFRRSSVKNNENQVGGDFSKFLPYLGPVLVFFGMARLIFYYKLFSIDIIQFLAFSEIITSFFDFFIVVVFSLSFFLMMLPVFMYTGKRSFRNNLLKLIIVYLLGMAYSVIPIYLNMGINLYYIGIGFVYFLIVMTYLGFIYYWKRRIANVDTEFLSLVFPCGAIAFGLIAIWIASWIDVRAIKVYKRNYGVNIVYKDSTRFKSDSSIYFIGNTNNYFFIYNEEQNTTQAIKMEEVKSIIFPEKKVLDVSTFDFFRTPKSKR